MITDYQLLKPLISNYVHNEIFKYDNGFPIEVHLSASSVLRKDFTKNKIQNLISKHDLNLKVFESSEMEQNDRFIISKK